MRYDRCREIAFRKSFNATDHWLPRPRRIICEECSRMDAEFRMPSRLWLCSGCFSELLGEDDEIPVEIT